MKYLGNKNSARILVSSENKKKNSKNNKRKTKRNKKAERKEIILNAVGKRTNFPLNLVDIPL